MKKYIISLFLVAFLLVPVLSKAQEEDIDPNPNGSECVVIVNNLKYKSRDANTNGEVSTLQDFLQTRGYLNSEPTGYFGINTGKAVKNFQKDNNFAQTGYVGSLTRAKIRALTCGGIVVDTTKPVISGVSGPQTLNINQTGTWKVSAYDKNGGNLSYSVNWGDENYIDGRDSGMLRYRNITQQSATFTHSYANAGTYNPTFTVTNSNGKIATTTLTVKVGQIEVAPIITVLSPNGGEVINVSNPITITFNSNNAYPVKHYINLVDETLNKSYSLDSLLGSYGLSLSQAQINQIQQSVIVSIPGSYNLDVNHNYKIEICVNNLCDKSNNYFRIISSNIGIPVISGVSGPQTLNVNQTGTWKVSAYDKNGGNLSYSVNWGDVVAPIYNIGTSYKEASQSATFTHSYSNAGTYNPTFTVTNSNGQSTKTILTVKVGVITVSTSPQIISTIGNQSNYSANSEINFVVKTADGIGGIATRAEGYNLQAYIFPANDPNFDGNYITPNPADSYNASFSDGYWRVKMNAPSTSGSYNMRVVLYCSNPAWGVCSSTAQDVRVLPFTVNSNLNAQAPTFTTTPVTFGGGQGWAIINGNYNSNNSPISKVWFYYGTNINSLTSFKDYELKQPLTGSGVIGQSIGGFTPGQTYYYKICGINTVDTNCSSVSSFVQQGYSNPSVPVISGVSGPQTLGIGQTGTWTVSAYNTNGGNLSYSVIWGDAIVNCPTGIACSTPMPIPQQSATFTHSYANAGTYNPTFIVTNSNGQTATTSLSVNVN